MENEKWQAHKRKATERFETNFDELNRYITELKRYPTADDDETLHRWMHQQMVKHRYGMLPDAQEARFKEIHFLWQPQQQLWYRKAGMMKKFVEANGKLPTESSNKVLRYWFNKTMDAFLADQQLSKAEIDVFREVINLIDTLQIDLTQYVSQLPVRDKFIAVQKKLASLPESP